MLNFIEYIFLSRDQIVLPTLFLILNKTEFERKRTLYYFIRKCYYYHFKKVV